MIPPDKLKLIHYFEHIPDPILSQLSEVAEERTFHKGEFILRQHDEATTLYLLLSGTVQFLLRFEGIDDLIVGTTSKKYTIIGWSAFRIPYRHTASVRCEDECHLLSLPT